MTTLVADIPAAWLSEAGGLVHVTLGSWQVLSIGVSPMVAYYEAPIDLAGLTILEQTLFPVSAMIQGNQELAVIGYVAGDLCRDVTVVSTTPMTDDDIINAGLGYMPGMTTATSIPTLGTTNAGMDLQNIVFGQTRTWIFDTNSDPFLRLISSDNFGTNRGVASGKLFCYRIVTVPTTSTAVLQIYPTAALITGVIDEEEDLVRLLRMKRNTRIQP